MAHEYQLEFLQRPEPAPGLLLAPTEKQLENPKAIWLRPVVLAEACLRIRVAFAKSET